MIRAPHLGAELTRLARSPRPHTVRILFVGVLLALAIFTWPWWQAKFDEMLQGSVRIFTVFFLAEMALAIFVVPALVAPAIPAEREAGTLELLVMCPEPEGHLVLGKMAAQVVFVGGILAAGFPLAFACTLLGGVPMGRAAGACVHIAMTAAFAACLALRCSLAWRGAAAASLAAVLIHTTIVFCSLAIAWMMAMVVEERSYGSFAIVVGIFAVALWVRWVFIEEAPTGCFGLIAIILVFIGVGVACASAPVPGRHAGVSLTLHALCPWVAYTHDAIGSRHLPWEEVAIPWVLQGIGCVLLLRGASAAAGSGQLLFGRTFDSWKSRLYDPQFRSEWRDRQRAVLEARRSAGEKLEVPPVLPPKRFALHPRGDLFNMAKDNPFLPVGSNPVYWKETSWMRFPGLNRLRALAIGTAWLCAAIGVLQVLDNSDSSWLMLVELWIITGLMVAATGPTIAEERESGTLAVLLSTGYPARRIVIGKAGAALRWCFPVILPIALHLLFVILFLGSVGAGAAFVFAATTLSVLGIGVAISAFSRRPRFAFGGTVLAIMSLWSFPLLVAGRWPDLTGILVLNPFVALGVSLGYRSSHLQADPVYLAAFAATSLGSAVLLPMLAAFRLERLVRA